MNRDTRSIIRYQARIARRSVRRAAQILRYRRPGLQGVPVLFANSFPKSGTHLLTQVLQGFHRLGPAVESGLPAIVTFEGDTGRPRPVEEILDELRRLLPGDIAYGHLHALPQVAGFMRQEGFCNFFILRDPRDVVVSHVYYVTEMEPDHIHHRYYREVLTDFDQRLRTSIRGLPGTEIPFPDIRARFEPYLGWLDCKDVLALRYEDFITHREAALGRVLDHALARGFPTHCSRPEAIRILAEGIDPQRSPTFRQGKTGGWREKFNTENKLLFKEITGDLLIRLGYEGNNDW